MFNTYFASRVLSSGFLFCLKVKTGAKIFKFETFTTTSGVQPTTTFNISEGL